MPAWPALARAPLLPFPSRARAALRCLPPFLRPRASGTSRSPSLPASSSDGIPQFPLLRLPSLCRAPHAPSPPSRAPAPGSKKNPRSASQTACPHPAPAAECTCPPRPSAHLSAFPTSLPRSALPAPSPAPPESRPRAIDTASTARALPVPPLPNVPVFRLVLHVRHRDRDPPLAFLRRVVDRIKRPERHLRVVLRQNFGDRRRQRRLAVIDVPNRPDIQVRLVSLEFFLRHRSVRSSASAF